VSEQPIAGDAPAPPVFDGEPVHAGAPGPEGQPVPPAESGAAATGDEAEPEAERSPWDDPRLPWEGKPRRVDIACWAAITLSGLYYLAILPWRASLVGTHPVLSILLNGSLESIVSAAAFARVGHGTLVVVLLSSIVGLMKFDLIYWWAGRLWGERVINLFAGRSERQRRRGQKFVARINRWGRWPAGPGWAG